MGIEHVRAEIDRMRVQVGRQRKDILQLQRAGISTASAELLLQRMLAKIDSLCGERDRLRKEQGGPVKGKALGGRPSVVAAPIGARENWPPTAFRLNVVTSMSHRCNALHQIGCGN
jgi:hypothetical protein